MIGSGNNGQLTFLDTVSLMSFCISIMNLNENLGQSDKQELMNGLSQKASELLNEIHSHLEAQDKKIDQILEVLNASK
jgi:hypothetical protein